MHHILRPQPLGFALPLLFLLYATSLSAQWKTASYAITFETKNAGFRVQGSLSDLSLSVLEDKDHLLATLQGSVPTHSLSTKNKMRDRHLMEKNYFDEQHFPTIHLSSVGIKRVMPEGNLYLGKFALTIKDVTKTIPFPFYFKARPDNQAASLEGSFRINRQDFHIGKGSLILSDSITVHLLANLIK